MEYGVPKPGAGKIDPIQFAVRELAVNELTATEIRPLKSAIPKGAIEKLPVTKIGLGIYDITEARILMWFVAKISIHYTIYLFRLNNFPVTNSSKNCVR